MYTALYRAYRPEVFEQLLGQDHIVRILKNQIRTGTTSHAYLFCGTRGTGKTTTARLLAKGLNCESDGDRPCGECSACRAIAAGSFLDVSEIDAASNRGIEDIRALRESVNYPPAMGRHKVYIIDEVHMLSTEAFNALLKTLEEPPEYVTFILATTEVQKLPATILSRCLRLDFKRIPETTLVEGMRKICSDIGIRVTDHALRIIAANADGSVRDGLSILDQCISGGEKTVDAPDVLDFLGASGEEVFLRLTDLVCKKKTAEAIQYLAEVLADGKDVRQMIRDWINHYRNLMITRYIRDPGAAINLSAENIDRIRRQSDILEPEEINRGIMELSKTMNEARWSTQPRILLELCIVKLSQGGSGPRPAPEPSPPGDTGSRSRPHRAERDPGYETGSPEETRAETKARLQNETEGAASGSGRPGAPAEDGTGSGAPEEPPGKDDAPVQEAAEEISSEGKPDLTALWNDVFTDGEKRIGSIYLIRKNSMLTDMDEGSFTVTVDGQLNRHMIEKNRQILEELMEGRTGRRRSLQVRVGDIGRSEPSVEEAAANASALLGTEVGIE